MIILKQSPSILSCKVSTMTPLQDIGCISRFAHDIEESQYLEEGMKILAGDVFSVSENIFIDLEVEISERLARQVNRHRHIAIVQKSTRYNDYIHQEELAFYLPSDIPEEYWKNVLESHIQHMKDSKNMKIGTESLNYLLPLASMTKVHYHINLRSLIHMFQVRSCKQALPEFQQFMHLLKTHLTGYGCEWDYIMMVYATPQCVQVGVPFHCKNPSLYCEKRPQWEKLSKPSYLLSQLEEHGEYYKNSLELSQKWDQILKMHQKIFNHVIDKEIEGKI